MKSHIFFAVSLKGIAASPGQDLAPREAETYCMTYLPTDLVAIPNKDGRSSSIDGDDEAPDGGDSETARLPLAPSLRPTFGENTSIATTSTSQGAPPSGAVTKGFASTGTSLSFQNDDLLNGEAGFCQTSNGDVYITFTSAPPGCTPVTLGVYGVSRCQNDKLVGVDYASSISPTTITEESTIVSEEAITLSSEAVEPHTSSFGVTTLQPHLASSYETPSSIKDVASTTSSEFEDPARDTPVLSTSDSSSSELAESTSVLDSTSTT
ncbi:uncharacterized protein FMAN_11905 [Fusarium mangiferae]|uniref:DUF7908 domain-containing protein n=1 Tax=Fusarium mangiferae TaxID=192010 RepID=A0A1L7U8V7_FUSMA|nr:uncharacterized protein FMAN_11905 [Fusarium mangiferae]CVL06809.1 uncharacterized protein FMAN_11905 [Fusarium mangiferae]